MDHQQRSLRAGAWVIFCALVLRLWTAGFFDPVAAFLAQPKISSFLIYLETGRIVRFSASDGTFSAFFAGESPAPDFGGEEVLPVFAPEEADTIEMRYNCTHRPDLAELLTEPLDWDLTGQEPAVLILHTHATESYTKESGERYEESAAFRTLDDGHNMVRIGERLAELLEAGGLGVIHDKTLHDYPSYNGSYSAARKAIDSWLEEYPSIKLVLDLHRDASGDNSNQMKTHATVAGKASAQLMLVVGTNYDTWRENLSLALKLQVRLEENAPGICRYINLRSQRFNQDKSPGALLVEVGAAGNTQSEALTAVEVLAQSILDLKKGTGS